MADLFSLTAPLLIRYPDGRSEVMVERFAHPDGLLYFRIFHDCQEAERAIRLVTGQLRGEGPWKLGDAVITVLGCHGSNPEQAAEFADWQLYREYQGNECTDREALREIARRAGYLS